MENYQNKSHSRLTQKIDLLKSRKRKILEILKEKIRRLEEINLRKRSTHETDTLFPTVLSTRILLESQRLLCGIIDESESLTFGQIIDLNTLLILNQKTTSSTWNYWKRHSNSASTTPFPDDLDDTFNALYVLYESGTGKIDQLITPEILSHVVQILLKTELSSEGTFYNTWISKDINFKDIDPVVQVIVFRVLEKFHITPEKFKESMKKYIDNSLEHIAQNPNAHLSKYYFSNAYILMEFSYLPVTDKDMLHTLINTLENIHVSDRHTKKRYPDIKTIEMDKLYLAQAKANIQNVSDLIFFPSYTSLPLSGFSKLYIEFHKGNKFTYKGSMLLDIAFEIRYFATIIRKIHDEIIHIEVQKVKSSIEKDLQEKVKPFITKVPDTFETMENVLNRIFKNKAMFIIENLIHELYVFSANLWKDGGAAPDKEYFIDVCKIQVYGWICYSISDMIIDDEIPKRFIGMSLEFNMHIQGLLCKLLRGSDQNTMRGIYHICRSILSELNTCQYQANYGFADSDSEGSKSIGHVLAFILLIRHIPHIAENDIDILITMYKNVLACKQLSDDAHDVEEDIKGETSNFITQRIRTHRKFKKDSTVIKEIFYEEVLPDVERRMTRFTSEALEYLEKLQPLVTYQFKEIYKNIITRYQNGIQRAVLEVEATRLLTQK